MCRHAGPLDALVAHEIASRTGAGCGCSCGRCCASRWPPAASKAVPDQRATRRGAGGRALPAWGGWSAAVTLRDIRRGQAAAAAGQPVSAAVRPFLATGRPQIYRIARAGIDRDRPLSIGMTETGRSVAQRIAEHHGQPFRGDPAVHAAIRNFQPGQILVQAGRLGGAMNVRRARGYEAWLQDRERPLISGPAFRTLAESGALFI